MNDINRHVLCVKMMEDVKEMNLKYRWVILLQGIGTGYNSKWICATNLTEIHNYTCSMKISIPKVI